MFFANALSLALFGLKDFLFRILPTTVALVSILVFYLALLKRRIVAWLSVLLTAQVVFWLLGPEFHDSGLNDAETYGFAFTLLGFSFGWLSGSIESRPGRIALQVLSGICLGLAVFSTGGSSSSRLEAPSRSRFHFWSTWSAIPRWAPIWI